MHEIDTEKAEEIDKRGNERDNGEKLGESDDVERSRRSDLVAPPVEKIIRDGEEESEENAVGEVEGEWESVRGFWCGVLSGWQRLFDGGVRVAWGNIPARFHWEELSGGGTCVYVVCH